MRERGERGGREGGRKREGERERGGGKERGTEGNEHGLTSLSISIADEVKGSHTHIEEHSLGTGYVTGGQRTLQAATVDGILPGTNTHPPISDPGHFIRIRPVPAPSCSGHVFGCTFFSVAGSCTTAIVSYCYYVLLLLLLCTTATSIVCYCYCCRVLLLSCATATAIMYYCYHVLLLLQSCATAIMYYCYCYHVLLLLLSCATAIMCYCYCYHVLLLLLLCATAIVYYCYK